MAKQEEQLAIIDKKMSNADFWQNDQEEISRLSQERASLHEKIDQWNTFHQEAEDTRLLADSGRSKACS